jgi:hypothetical protein
MLLRVLVVLLLCMNLAVAAWWALHDAPAPEPPPPATDPGVASLVLLSESPRPPPAASAELSTDPGPLPAGSACLSLGPFETAEALRGAMNLLLPRVDRIQYREVAATVLRGYQVSLPPAASRADALALARALAARGINDYYVVTAGEAENSVSLGIFKDLANATQRRDAVTALGFAPVMESRTSQEPQWWIDLAAPAGFDWRGLLPEADALRAVDAPCG